MLHYHQLPFGYQCASPSFRWVKFQEHFSVILLLRGLRPILGDSREQKLPITPDILHRLYSQFRLPRDSGFWAAMLISFFTFFRESNLVRKSLSTFDSSRNFSRQDIVIRPWGMVIVVHWSKTIQFCQRYLLIPVMGLPTGHPLCPVQAYEDHLQAYPQPPSSPAFFFTAGSRAVPITHTIFTSRLHVSLRKANTPVNTPVIVLAVVLPLTPSAVGHPLN